MRYLLYAITDQRGIDVSVTLFAPDGAKLLEIDRTSSQLGDESLWYIFSSSGKYRLEVRSLKKAAPEKRERLAKTQPPRKTKGGLTAG